MTIAVLAVLIVLVTLGNWQMQRLAWKEDLIAQVEERTHSAPVPLDHLLAEGAPETLNFRPVTVRGTFDHAREVHVFGRSLDGHAGYYIYTPLERVGGATVIVNRGFVPTPLKAAYTRAEGQLEGEVTITGLAHLPSPGNMFEPENDVEGNVWFRPDLDQMADAMGLGRAAPVFVDADGAANPGRWPLGGQTRVTFRNNHLGYALTWYGLALTLIAVYIAVHIGAGRLGFGRARTEASDE